MIKKIYAVALAIGLLFYSASAMAMMHKKGGMSEPGMYNLTIGGLAGGDDAKGIDKKFRQMNGVKKVHVDFDNGMVMVWMKKGNMLDQGLAEMIVKKSGFTLNEFEPPK